MAAAIRTDDPRKTYTTSRGVASMLTAAAGLLLGTLMDPRKKQMLFAVILLLATMLGCVYYPWSALHQIRWLQIC